MSTRIIVKNLPKDTKQEKLIDHIRNTSQISEITDCNLKYTQDGIFRRFAFVGFNTTEEAVSAQAKLNGTFIKTTKIQVDIARDVGDANIKAWSKYSVVNIPKKGTPSKAKVDDGNLRKRDGDDAPSDAADDTEKPKEEKPAKNSGFVVKMRGLTGFYTEKTIKEFFKPLKTTDVRIPKNAQKKPIGVAFVEFSKQKDLDQAMGRNKNFINGKKVFLKKSNEVLEAAKPVAPSPWEIKAKEGTQHEVENIGDSGRLFVRNLWFGVTEEELEEVFGKYGPLAEVTLPVDPLTKKIKGFAHIVYVFPEHALKAFTHLDYTSFHGRLLHILPGRDLTAEEESNEKSSYKKKKDQQNKANSSSSYNWNTLFLGANAVADAMAVRYNTDKSNILDDESRGSVGVRMALGETQIVSETREFLISNGVALDSFSQAAGQRSKTVVLVKNLPSGVSSEELKGVFGKHGTVLRVVMPPAGITAIVEYLDSSEAKKGFAKLNFSKFRSIPLYLEWAPMGIFSKSDPDRQVIEEEKEMESKKTKEEEKIDSDGSDRDDETSADDKEKAPVGTEESMEMKVDNEPEDETTLFVKNLNFDTDDETLKEHFSQIGPVYSASVAKKKDSKRPGELLSMGYGFVQLMKRKDAKEALKILQNSVLDGHNLELKLSTRTIREIQGRKKQNETKQISTKILVRNIPFEAKKKEIEELFKVFGDLKFVRLPKKLKGTGPHRGFAFVDFQTKQDAKRAFDALCHSTHLFGRRLVLEWAEAEESIEDLRRKTAQHFTDDQPQPSTSSRFTRKRPTSSTRTSNTVKRTCMSHSASHPPIDTDADDNAIIISISDEEEDYDDRFHDSRDLLTLSEIFHPFDRDNISPEISPMTQLQNHPDNNDDHLLLELDYPPNTQYPPIKQLHHSPAFILQTQTEQNYTMTFPPPTQSVMQLHKYKINQIMTFFQQTSAIPPAPHLHLVHSRIPPQNPMFHYKHAHLHTPGGNRHHQNKEALLR